MAKIVLPNKSPGLKDVQNVIRLPETCQIKKNGDWDISSLSDAEIRLKISCFVKNGLGRPKKELLLLICQFKS